MSATIIPERTIDAWFAIVLGGFDPFARVWAPSPRAQAGTDPWDWAIAASHPRDKLFVLEMKAPRDDAPLSLRKPHVLIDLEQLLYLAATEAVLGIPAFVGFPMLDLGDLRAIPAPDPMSLATLRFDPPFSSWLRVPSALSLATDPAVVRRIARNHDWYEYPTDGARRRTAWPDLMAFLAGVRQCAYGPLLTSGGVAPMPPAWRSIAGRATIIKATRGAISRVHSTSEEAAAAIRSAVGPALQDLPTADSGFAEPTPLTNSTWVVVRAAE